MSDALALERRPLPVGSLRRHASGWWVMLCLIVSEGAIFAYLLFAYYYFTVQPHSDWPPGGPPSLTLALPNTLILFASSVTAWWAERAIKGGRRDALLLGLLLTFVLGAIFLGIQIEEWREKSYSLDTGPYGSLYFTITGFHMAHVAVGLVMLALLWLWSWLGYFDRLRCAPISIGALYWHFVDAVWIVVFLTFYVTPLLR
jgi:cytochrome c oxidase subunit 3